MEVGINTVNIYLEISECSFRVRVWGWVWLFLESLKKISSLFSQESWIWLKYRYSQIGRFTVQNWVWAPKSGFKAFFGRIWDVLIGESEEEGPKGLFPS